jgi:hypothetical protein
MVAHIALEKIHGRDVYLIRTYNNMKELTDPTKCAIDLYECAEVVCSKEALEAFNEVGSEEELYAYSLEDYDKMVERINNG